MELPLQHALPPDIAFMGNCGTPADRRKLLTILDFIVFGGGNLLGCGTYLSGSGQ